MSLRTFAATLLMTAALSGLPPSRVTAQSERRPAPQTTQTPASLAADAAGLDRFNAHDTRQRLREILNDYPPSLAQVLRLDPSLLTNPAYLAPYPTLAAYLAQHPDVAHNPGYFLGYASGPDYNNRSQLISSMQDVLIGAEVATFFVAALFVVGGVARALMAHKRWLQATKTQTEAHTKLVDRLTSNEDLLAYVQSPTGQRFLSAVPVIREPDARFGTPAPIGRILTSVQVGLVVAFGGVGLWIAKNRVIEEVAQPLHVVAILAMALGIGFVVSALVSYGLSRQLGLLQSTPSSNG